MRVRKNTYSGKFYAVLRKDRPAQMIEVAMYYNGLSQTRLQVSVKFKTKEYSSMLWIEDLRDCGNNNLCDKNTKKALFALEEFPNC